MRWRDALLRLHTHGWNADEIDEACEALHETCEEGMYDGTDLAELTLAQVQAVLNVTLDHRLLECIHTIAVWRRRLDQEGDDLRRALYDLDGFAYRSSTE